MNDSTQQFEPSAFSQSVAGEEDPGASLDIVLPSFPAGSQPSFTTPSQDRMSPGDEAPPGTPGTGEGLCRVCGGTGSARVGTACPACSGTGRVIVGIGGA